MTSSHPLLELRAREHDWFTLMRHLFPGDRDEHGAVVLCGTANTQHGSRLLVREVVLAVDGRDYVPGTRGYRHLTGEFVTHQVRKARDEGLVYLAVHNHGGLDSVGFSRADLESHERAYPTLLGVTKQPVGALVCTERAAAGDIWLPSGQRAAIESIEVVGTRRQVLRSAPQQPTSDVADRFTRQALLFGAEGQAVLASLKVVVVGAGGVGMLLIQYLARLGIGHIVVIDPERVEVSNLSRLPEARRLDAMALPEWIPHSIRRLADGLRAPKVRVARRVIRRASRNTTITAVLGDIADEQTAALAKDSDYIFLAADTMLARDVVNQLAYQFLIPTLQVGSKVVINPSSGSVIDTFAAVRHIGTTSGCLRCAGLVDPVRLSEESLGDPTQVQRQRYVADPEVHAPSVITLNALGSGFGANDFMLYAVGLGGADPAHRLLRNRPVGQSGTHVTVIDAPTQPQCPVCSSAPHSALSRGDSVDLPTRVGRRRV
jgi:molybdopterin/thiamine biosynthesis adenylyltransferase